MADVCVGIPLLGYDSAIPLCFNYRSCKIVYIVC